MKTAQHKLASRVLRLIEMSAASSSVLTYTNVARALNRPESHARAVAQACDLLDAAACSAGVPSLALVKVRAKDETINAQAWREDLPLRAAIIRRSEAHNFSSGEYKAISQALDSFGSLGNKQAWASVHSTFAGELFRNRLLGTSVRGDDAIDDLGTDFPDRAKSTGWAYSRSPKVRTAVIARARGRCEFCGELGFKTETGQHYIECHHIIALAKQGRDRVSNVIALCPNHHRMAHYAVDAELLETKMVAKLEGVLNQSRRTW